MSSSDDEAPEQVSMAMAKTQAIESRASEKQARASAKATAALKRKRQPKKKEETVIEALPDDILAAVAAAQDEPNVDADGKQEEEAVVQPKKSKKTKKNSHTRRFGNIEVTTVASLEEEAAPVSDSIAKFIELRSAPHRERANYNKALLKPVVNSRSMKAKAQI